MSQYSPIGSVELLLELQKHKVLGNYLLLLAHDVFENQHLYTELLRKFNGTIILDNSLIELGEPVSADIMLQATTICRPNYVVLPDKLLNSAATVELSIAGFKELETELSHDIGYCIVAQGNNAEECVSCAEQIRHHIETYSGCDRDILVSVPRALVVAEGSRLRAVSHLANAGYDKIHLLGMSRSFADDIICAKHNNVIGIDSATPIRCGFESIVLPNAQDCTDPAAYLGVDRDEFFKLCKEPSFMTIYNIAYMRGAIDSKGE